MARLGEITSSSAALSALSGRKKARSILEGSNAAGFNARRRLASGETCSFQREIVIRSIESSRTPDSHLVESGEGCAPHTYRYRFRPMQ